jgi:hypothetical protein
MLPPAAYALTGFKGNLRSILLRIEFLWQAGNVMDRLRQFDDLLEIALIPERTPVAPP